MAWGALMILSVASGCRATAPIHVWQPPRLQSTVGQRVAVSVSGPATLAADIEQRLIDAAAVRRRASDGPGEGDGSAGTSVWISTSALQQASAIRLVSADDQEFNDVALASVARDRGVDFLLQGRLVEGGTFTGPAGETERIALSWRLYGVHGRSPPIGFPVAIDVDTAVDRYPDLRLLAEPRAILQEAAVRETRRLVEPFVNRDTAGLAVPYLTPGSRAVRRGNALAAAGDWSAARDIWAETVQRYPSQSAAFVNLAVAAVAAQDFPAARQWATLAAARHPSAVARETLLWVEWTQRQYHLTFGLPDPEEGWVLTRIAGETP